MAVVSSQDAAAVFDPLRPVLTRVAYRMLGSAADAEDVVQDAFLRWLDVDRDAMREPEAFLRRVVMRWSAPPHSIVPGGHAKAAQGRARCICCRFSPAVIVRNREPYQGNKVARRSSLLMLTLAATFLSAGAASPASPANIDSLEDVTLGGLREKILIQGDDLANPLLLWLHGGPGEPAMFLSHHFSATLKKHMTIVHWDQPGTGLSYDPGHPLRELSEERIECDALELIDKLLKRFGRTKLYVLGHSFGTVIGTRLVASHPDRFCAYIGMGQVVNGPKSIQLTRDWLKADMTRANDREGLERLAGASFFEVFNLVKARGGVLHAKVDYRAILKSSPYYFEGYWELKKKANAATWKLMTKANGGTQGFAVDQVRTLQVPAFYFTGRHDRVPATAPELVVDYVGKLRAPHKEIVWFENSGHLPNLEEPQAFQDAIVGKVKATTKGCGLAN